MTTNSRTKKHLKKQHLKLEMLKMLLLKLLLKIPLKLQVKMLRNNLRVFLIPVKRPKIHGSSLNEGITLFSSSSPCLLDQSFLLPSSAQLNPTSTKNGKIIKI